MASDATALVLFSGGQDSTVCLAWALARYDRVETIGFDYGQTHKIELGCRPRIIERLRALYPVWAPKIGADHLLQLETLNRISDTALTREAEITLAADGLPTTFVPGRNLLFLTYAAALGYRRDIDRLVGGMCETDYSGYPDCRRATLDALEQALSLGMDRRFTVETPLMQIDKAATWRLAEELGGAALVDLILEETHSCYRGDHETRHDWGYGCGTCPACQLRARGYEAYRSAHV